MPQRKAARAGTGLTAGSNRATEITRRAPTGLSSDCARSRGITHCAPEAHSLVAGGCAKRYRRTAPGSEVIPSALKGHLLAAAELGGTYVLSAAAGSRAE